MELEDIKRIVYSSYKVYLLRKKLYGTVGCCRLNKSGSVVIMLDPKLKEGTQSYNLVLKHELGHIYFRHFDNREEDLEEIKKLYKKKRNKNASLNKCHTILNICEDIVIHDSILTIREVKDLEKYLNVKLCTSQAYKAPPFLTYEEYYDYVIKPIATPQKQEPNIQLPFEGNPGPGGPCTEGPDNKDEDNDPSDDDSGSPTSQPDDSKQSENPQKGDDNSDSDKSDPDKEDDDNGNPDKEDDESDENDGSKPVDDSDEEGNGSKPDDDSDKEGSGDEEDKEDEDDSGNSASDDSDKEDDGAGDDEESDDPFGGLLDEDDDDFDENGGSLESEDDNGTVIDKTDKEIEDEGGVLQRLGAKGTSGESDKEREFHSDEPHEQLMEILRQLIIVKEKVSMSVDSIRKSERLRLKDGVFRKSLRQKLVKVKTRNPVTLLVDCSGSMDSVIRAVLSTIIEVKDKIDPESELILWSTFLGYEGKMRDIKSGELSYKPGGTRLSPGIRYCRKKYPNHKIVFISDYQDEDIPELRNTILQNRSSIIGICLGNKSLEEILSEFGDLGDLAPLLTDKSLYDHYIDWYK